MIDYLTDIKPLEDVGLDDANIAFALSVRTATPILCEATKVALEGSGAIAEDPVTQTRSGPLIDHYGTLSGAEAVLLAWFISHVMIRGVEITANTYPRSVEVASVISGLPAGLLDVADEIIELGGGRPDAGTTEADVVAARGQYEAEQAEEQRQQSVQAVQAEIENTWINPAMSDGVSTAAQVRAAIKAGL